jgi:hypothetical protein
LIFCFFSIKRKERALRWPTEARLRKGQKEPLLAFGTFPLTYPTKTEARTMFLAAVANKVSTPLSDIGPKPFSYALFLVIFIGRHAFTALRLATFLSRNLRSKLEGL